MDKPEIPIMGGEFGQRGAIACINKDGTINQKKWIEYKKAKKRYHIQLLDYLDFYASLQEWMEEECSK